MQREFKMKKIKNFANAFQRRLKRAAPAAACWFKELSAVKVTALIAANCFLLTSVYGQAAAAVLNNAREMKQFNQFFDNFELPYSYGKITSSSFTGSDTVVINIQDLHAHPGVQKNISKIISAFDAKFGVKNIYLEGAYGQVDTSWLSSAPNKELKEKVLNSMMESGRLTGAEYYSAISGRPGIIKGLENKKEYISNLKRFGRILQSQNEIRLITDSMSEDIDNLKATYYNKQQKKIDNLSKQYAEGGVDGKKYFALLYKHTDKLGIDIYKYENINLYKSLLAQEKYLDYKRVSAELHVVIAKLKEILPYQAYKMIVENTANFSEIDKLYVYLIKFSKEYNINLETGFPNLARFLNYVEISQKINPLELIKEEKKLVDEINERFSVNASEREAVFIAEMAKYFKDFLASKITADDYAYFQANKEEFMNLWVKYIDNKKLELLGEYIELAETFYTVNLDRNKYFFDNISGLDGSSKLSGVSSCGNSAEDVIKSLKPAKNVYVIITGGFHTQGVSQYLAKYGISTITITPNVTGGVQAAEEKYYRIAKEQSKVLFQALASLNLTQYVQDASKESAYAAMSEAIVGAGELSAENIKTANEFIADIMRRNGETGI